MRPIDADEIRKKAIPHTRGERAYCADIRKWAVLVGDLDDAPTLTLDDLRPHGRWNFIRVDKARSRACFECSECGTLFELEMFVAEEMSPKVVALLESGAATKDELLLLNGVNYNYCPNYCPSCGAKLDGSEDQIER